MDIPLMLPQKMDIHLDNLSFITEETSTAFTHGASSWEKKSKKVMKSTLRRNTNYKTHSSKNKLL